jgi:hypothetical protein
MLKHRLASIDWESKFLNKTTNQMVNIFSDIFLELIKSLVPNKTVTINDKDAPWVTPPVKKAILKNKRIYTNWIKKGRNPITHEHVKRVQRDTNQIITSAKDTYINNLGNKLCDPSTGHKSFWSAYKRLANKKKITNIPPLFENDRYETNFKNKARIFNDFFAAQCRPLVNESVLPPSPPSRTTAYPMLPFPMARSFLSLGN